MYLFVNAFQLLNLVADFNDIWYECYYTGG
jgi:hypothetical protein